MTAPPARRRAPSMRWWHKWIGITIGLVLLLWVVSGLAMVAPRSSAVWGSDLVEPTIDFSDVTITPNEAAVIAARQGSATGAPPTIRSVVLRPMLGTTVYLVTPVGAAPVLVDAATGDVITITAERASSIASSAMRGLTPVSVARIVVAPIGYGGRLPAYRMVFDDAAATVAIVAEVTGDMARTQKWDRIMMRVGHYVHVFVPLKRLPGGDSTRIMVLVGTSIIALMSIFSGYWLALPARLRRKRKA